MYKKLDYTEAQGILNKLIVISLKKRSFSSQAEYGCYGYH